MMFATTFIPLSTAVLEKTHTHPKHPPSPGTCVQPQNTVNASVSLSNAELATIKSEKLEFSMQ